MRTVEDLRKTYVVYLRPEIAAYDPDVGLRLGIAGSYESPPRIEPKRPGYAPLRAEAWADHVRRVAEEARRRLVREEVSNGILGLGIYERYAISPQTLQEAVTACALLHDLGKLQGDWQVWAEAAQRAKDSSYRHLVPLAHTDFDPASEGDRLRERELKVRRPPHAPASSYYAGGFLARLLFSAPGKVRVPLASACAGAVLAHHGGWVPDGPHYEVSGLWKGWEHAVASLLEWRVEEFAPAVRKLESHLDKKGATKDLLGITTSADSLAKWWPLVAYLTRTLRLSDQRATAEGATYD
jgi:CRISPR-associated endonuclease Cas3-HD